MAAQKSYSHLRDHPLLTYVLRRVGIGVALTLFVSILLFGATQLLPGDAATAILGRASANPVAVHYLRQQLGLDHSAVYQYMLWLRRFVSGNLGTSYAAQEPVTTLLRARVANTLILAGVTVALMIPLSLFLGTVAGVRRDRQLDNVISGFTLGAIALPEFISGTLLVLVFAVVLRMLPAVSLIGGGSNPFSSPNILVLPVVTLLISGMAYNVRMIRAGVADVMASDYVEAARLNGIPEGRIVRYHVLRNALAPSVQTVAQTVQWLVGGVVVVETVFQYPGIGQALVQAVSTRDIPVVQALGMLIALIYIVVNIVADVVVVLLIPKLRTEAR